MGERERGVGRATAKDVGDSRYTILFFSFSKRSRRSIFQLNRDLSLAALKVNCVFLAFSLRFLCCFLSPFALDRLADFGALSCALFIDGAAAELDQTDPVCRS